MSDKSGGFFSSVGRFFSGGSSNKGKEAEKSPTSSADDDSSSYPSSSEVRAAPRPATFLKNIISIDSTSPVENDDIVDRTPQVSASTRLGSSLRYLSPSVLDQRNNGLEIDVDPVSDIFFNSPSVSTGRKRQLTELDKQVLPQSFRSESVKRSRFLNRSLLEPTLKSNLNAECAFDRSWCGELTSNYSPASSITNFSLLSRRSGATTNGSLSTRTQEIYKKLEGATTPAKEVQRMTMLRAGLTRPEKWGNLSRGETASPAPPPPLKKAGDAIPSRIQLLSKARSVLPARESPYWRDLTRKRGESKNGDTESSDTHSLKSLNGNFASAELSSLFSLDPPKKAPAASAASTTSTNSRKPHISILKGPDGKPVGRNTFKLTDDDDEDSRDSQPLPPLPEAVLSNPQPLKLAPGAEAPKRGFLNNLSFTFSAPVDTASTVSTAKTVSIASSVRTSSKDADSDSCEETAEKASSRSSSSEEDSEESDKSDESEDEVEEVKESRPQTSADTISTANGSKQSSTEPSPKKGKEDEPAAPLVVKPAASAQWECQACFTNWPEKDTKCGCCGTAREGASAEKPAEKQLVSNLASFAPAKPAGSFSFGFGGGATSSAAPAAPAAPAKPIAFGTSTSSTTSTSLFGASKPAAPPAPAPVAAAPTPAATSSDRVAWECPDCFVSNKATDDKCPCCSHVKYQSSDSSSSSNVFGARAFNPTATGAAVSFGVGGGAAKPTFGFGVSKTTDAPAAPAPTPAPAFGFSAPAAPLAPAATAAPTPVPEPVKLPEPPKPDGSLFGNLLAKPAETTPAPPLFGTATGSLFAAPKPAAEEAPKTSMFGAAATTAAPAPGSIFAPSTTTTPFSGASLFGSVKPAEAPKPAATISFGGPPTTTEAPKTGIFGGLTSSTAAPSTTAPAPAPTSTASLFGAGSTSSSGIFAKPADSTTTSIFGNKPISFGGDVGTTTTDGGAPAKRGMFSTDSGPAAKLAFGGDSNKVEAPKLSFGGFGGSTAAPTTTGPLFGGAPATGMFGGPTSTLPAFGTSTSTTSATIPFGTSSSTFSFGGAPAAVPAFSGFGSKTTQPAMSNSSSTNSLFGQAAASETSNPFASTTTNNGGGFNFSQSSTTSTSSNNGNPVFQFGSSIGGAAPAAAPSGTAFQFGGNLAAPPAPGSMDNAFAYQAPTGASGRKMAMARRRNIRK